MERAGVGAREQEEDRLLLDLLREGRGRVEHRDQQDDGRDQEGAHAISEERHAVLRIELGRSDAQRHGERPGDEDHERDEEAPPLEQEPLQEPDRGIHRASSSQPSSIPKTFGSVRGS